MADKAIFNIKRPAKIAYRLGLGPLVGRVFLLLTTTGRKSGLARVTPLQYEIINGQYVVVSVKGTRADWVRNIQANPAVTIRVKQQTYQGTATIDTDQNHLTDFLMYRYQKRPRMIAGVLKLAEVPVPPSREDLFTYAAHLAMVKITPE